MRYKMRTEIIMRINFNSQSGHDEEDEREAKGVTGIPGFWLTTMKNVDLLADMIQVQWLMMPHPYCLPQLSL